MIIDKEKNVDKQSNVEIPEELERLIITSYVQ